MNHWLENQPAAVRWPLRFLSEMVTRRAWLIYVPAGAALIVAWWENGRLVWLNLGLIGPDWSNAVEVGLPIAQRLTLLLAIGLLVIAGVRTGWDERGRRLSRAAKEQLAI